VSIPCLYLGKEELPGPTTFFYPFFGLRGGLVKRQQPFVFSRIIQSIQQPHQTRLADTNAKMIFGYMFDRVGLVKNQKIVFRQHADTGLLEDKIAKQ
jgi:hypothetical protein